MTDKNTSTDLVVIEDATEGLPLITKHNLSVLHEQRKLFKEFIKDQLVEGSDYGRYGQAKKDSLLKPGAEKLRRLFSLGSRIIDCVKTETTEYVSFAYTFEVYSIKTGKVLAQCIGSANSVEQRHWEIEPLKFANTISKIAQKRADVGATISATGASDFFTQDMEDVVNSQNTDSHSHQISQEPSKLTEKQIKRLFAITHEMGWTNDELRNTMSEFFGKTSTSELDWLQYEKLVKHIQEHPMDARE